MNDLFDTAPCGFLSFADDGTILLANATLLGMLGYQRDDLHVRQIESLLPPGSRVFYRAYFAPCLKLQGALDEVYMASQTTEGAELPSCRAGPALLKQVWVNLLANALKYSRRRDGAVIAIASRAEGDQIIHVVRDNGVGFDMRDSDLIFARRRSGGSVRISQPLVVLLGIKT
jgi:signal transduction histidine kinase